MMAFRQLSDYDYLKSVLYLERLDELGNTNLDKQTKLHIRDLEYVLDLHDQNILPYKTMDMFEFMRLKSGYDFIKALKC